ncbi:MAG: hypothetical protein KKB51_01535 [Candidatus Riflebacteria bacterium]|nr:hypothetical protein [Candidatus Riflebacteria bacterium]
MKMKIFLVLFAIVVLCIAALFYFGPFQLKNPAYLWWVMTGSECSQKYLEDYVFVDCNKSLIVRGLTEDKIKKRFPVLFDGDNFPEGSNRQRIIQDLRNTEYKDQNFKMLWFDDQYEWGWAILLVDGKGLKIDMFKQ